MGIHEKLFSRLAKGERNKCKQGVWSQEGQEIQVGFWKILTLARPNQDRGPAKGLKTRREQKPKEKKRRR